MSLLIFALVVLAIFLIGIIQALSWGLTFYMFYWWFVLPVFDSMPEISYAMAVGLAVFVGLFKNKNIYNNIPEDERLKQFGMVFVRPFTVLLIGYLVKIILL